MLNRTRQTFITSDLHFNHANIIRYCNRPYHVEPPNKNPINLPAVEAMNEDILKMFDNLPSNCDIWNLGDVFYFSGKLNLSYINGNVFVNKLAEITNRMKGDGRRLYLVLGNHDNIQGKGISRIDFYRSIGFDYVYDAPVIVEDKYILSHEPVYIKPESNFINLYGHTHDLEIKEDYFVYDYENYAMECRVFAQNNLKNPAIEARYPERKISLKNYKNMCLDYNNGILEWKSDYFKLATVCWPNKEKKNENY